MVTLPVVREVDDFKRPVVAKEARVEVGEAIVVQVYGLQLFGGEKSALLNIDEQVVAEVDGVKFSDMP